MRRAFLRKDERLSVALFLLFLTGFSLPLFLGLRYFGLDFTLITLAHLCEIKTLFKHGWSLGISPFIGGGDPLYANVATQLLYPVRWIELLFTPELGGGIGVAIHLSLAATGSFWLARSFELNRSASIACATLFAFSGTTLDLIGHSHYLVGAAWLPAAWASTRAILRARASSAALILFVASFSFFLLGGDPQSFVIAGGIVMIEAISSFRQNPASLRIHVSKLTPFIGLITLSLLISFLHWGPTWAELKLGRHLHGFSNDLRNTWNYGPASWLATLWPGLLIEKIQHASTLWAISMRHQALDPTSLAMTWNRSPYLGLLWISLFIAGIRQKRTRSAAFVVSIALIFALGNQTPLSSFFEFLIPPLQIFRFPSKYLLIFTLAAGVVAAQALHSLSGTGKTSVYSRHFIWVASSVLGMSLLASLTIGLNQSAIDLWAAQISSDWKGSFPTDAPTLSQLLLNSSLTASMPLALGIIVVRFTRFGTLVLPLLMVFDLLVAASFTSPLGASMIETQSPISTVLHHLARKQNPPVLCSDQDMNSAEVILPDARSGLWSETRSLRLFDCPNIGACDEIRMGTPYSAVNTPARSELKQLLMTHRSAGAYGLGCTHFLTLENLNLNWLKPTQLPSIEGIPNLERSVHLYEVIDPLPSAFVVRSPLLFQSTEFLIKAISIAKSWSEAVRVVDDPLNRISASTALPSGTAITKVTAIWHSPTEIDISAEGSGSGMIGVKTVFAVGWKAMQGAHELPVLRVGGAQTAVRVDDALLGPIRLRYRPPLLTQGFWISGSAALFSVLLLALSHRRKLR